VQRDGLRRALDRVRRGLAAPDPIVLRGVAVGAALAALAGLVLLAAGVGRTPEPQPLGAIKPAPAPEPQRPPDPLTRALIAPPGKRQGLPPGPFARIPLATPAALCGGLATLGFPEAQVEAAPFSGAGWSCVAERLLPVPADGEPSSVFAALRGPKSSSVGVIRLKLNVLRPADAAAVIGAGLAALDGLHRELGWSVPGPVRRAVQGLSDLALEHSGVRYSVSREFGDPPRLNVVMTFGHGATILDADRFAPVPRRP
jgi:hypothetical protein